MKTKNGNKYVPISLKASEPISDKQLIEFSRSHFNKMKNRRTIRDFSDRDTPRCIIEDCVRVAGLAPSGANQQPWHFCLISDKKIKKEIRHAAETQEKIFYSSEKNYEWLKVLQPLGTDINKPHLELAPWLIVVFAERYGQTRNGEKSKNYYVPESVGIATGFLISALHLSGLHCLTHTPSPMGFLQNICQRPSSNKATLVIAVGHAAKDASYPAAASIKKPLNQIVSIF